MSDKFGPCFNGGYALSMAFILLSESLLYSVQFGLEVYDGNWTRNIWTILQLPAITVLFLTTSLLIFGIMAKKYKFILPWLFLGGPAQMVRINLKSTKSGFLAAKIFWRKYNSKYRSIAQFNLPVYKNVLLLFWHYKGVFIIVNWRSRT